MFIYDERDGTTSLYPALEIATGEVTAEWERLAASVDEHACACRRDPGAWRAPARQELRALLETVVLVLRLPLWRPAARTTTRSGAGCWRISSQWRLLSTPSGQQTTTRVHHCRDGGDEVDMSSRAAPAIFAAIETKASASLDGTASGRSHSPASGPDASPLAARM